MTRPLNRHFNKVDRGLKFFDQVGLFHLVRILSPDLLTVLNYHRIDDPYREGFDTFRPNISATPADFALQMDYVAENYNVISGTDLVSFTKGKQGLPKRAALITFDDGYFDNYLNAFPVLKTRGLPAIIFLTTNFIGRNIPFYWDLISYCFNHTDLEKVELPYLGLRYWADESTRTEVLYEWIAVLKKLPESEKQKIVEQLSGMMGVHVPDNAFRNIMMSWAHAREMCDNGIEMGGHTVNHPILTRVTPNEASQELINCKREIEDEINNPVLSFAYPNGQSADFNEEIIKMVKQAGFEVAFTLLPGPARKIEVLQNPLAIRRIFLSHKDTFPRFIAKLSGIDRISSKAG